MGGEGAPYGRFWAADVNLAPISRKPRDGGRAILRLDSAARLFAKTVDCGAARTDERADGSCHTKGRVQRWPVQRLSKTPGRRLALSQCVGVGGGVWKEAGGSPEGSRKTSFAWPVGMVGSTVPVTLAGFTPAIVAPVCAISLFTSAAAACTCRGEHPTVRGKGHAVNGSGGRLRVGVGGRAADTGG